MHPIRERGSRGALESRRTSTARWNFFSLRADKSSATGCIQNPNLELIRDFTPFVFHSFSILCSTLQEY
jgi:hypothetical protein